MQDLKAYLEATTDNYTHSDFLDYSRKTVTQLEHETTAVLLEYYYTTNVYVGNYKGHVCVWWSAQGRIT